MATSPRLRASRPSPSPPPPRRNPLQSAPMSNDEVDLARSVDAAQSILDTPAAVEARRIERALAACSRELAVAMAERDPASAAGTIEAAGGTVIFAGEGSPLTQGLAMGLGGPVSAADVDAVEAWLCPRPNRREAPGRGSVEP